MVGQFQRELLDLQVTQREFSRTGRERGIAFGERAVQGRQLRLRPLRQGRQGLVRKRLRARYHDPNDTMRP